MRQNSRSLARLDPVAAIDETSRCFSAMLRKLEMLLIVPRLHRGPYDSFCLAIGLWRRGAREFLLDTVSPTQLRKSVKLRIPLKFFAVSHLIRYNSSVKSPDEVVDGLKHILARPGFALSSQQGKTLAVPVYHLHRGAFCRSFGLLHVVLRDISQFFYRAHRVVLHRGFVSSRRSAAP